MENAFFDINSMLEDDLFYEYLDKISSPDVPLSEKKKCLKKAKAIHPDDLELAMISTDLETDDPIKKLGMYDLAIKKEEEKLEKDGFFKEYMGEFWLAFETRPYMRALMEKSELLRFLGRTLDAISLSERMLELNNNDNLGVRYNLMTLYALMIDEAKAKDLYAKYKEESAFMLLPFAILYFREGKYKECDKVLEKIKNMNTYLLAMIESGDFLVYEDEECPPFYSIGSYEEALCVVDENRSLLKSQIGFLIYLKNKSSKMPKEQNKKARSNIKKS